MKVIRDNGNIVGIELTERNLKVLLDKLELPGSACTIVDETAAVYIKAVPDDEHYKDRAPGIMFTREGII